MKIEKVGKNSMLLKQVRRAIVRGSLTENGLLPIEGRTLIQEALRSGLDIVQLFLDKEADNFAATGVPTITLESRLFRSIQATKTSQGVLALVRPPQFDIKDILQGHPQMLIVLCHVQDPGNAGTALRLAEAFGASCLATEGTVGIYNDKLVRASTGSLFRVPHCWNLSLLDLRQGLHSAGIRIVGTTPDARQPVNEYTWAQPTAVLFGNEAAGLDETEKASCDDLIRIPHRETVQSLNAAVATGIVLYEAFRQRDI